MLGTLVRLGAIFGFLIGSAISAGVASAQDQVTFTAGAAGSQNLRTASSIAKGISDATDLETVVQSYGGLDSWLPLINSGEGDFGVMVYEEASAALKGTGPHEGRPLENVRLVATLFPTRVGLFARKGSGIETVQDVKGRSVLYGYNTQPGIRENILAILATAGFGENDIRPVMVPTVGAGGDAFASGKADVGYFAYGAGKLVEVDNAVDGIRFLSLPPDSEAAVRQFVPSGYTTTVEPKEGVPGVDEPTSFLTVDYVLVAGAHVSEDVVYKVTQALAENIDGLAEANRQFGEMERKAMAKPFDTPFHEGARRYYEEEGLLAAGN
jgi:TRAP transporter TAXI family solute receptor